MLAQAQRIVVEPGPRRSKADAYLPFIHEALERWPTLRASRLYEMVKERGYKGGPSRFREVIAAIRPRRKATAYLRLRTLPGEQGQVDWGGARAGLVPRAAAEERGRLRCSSRPR